MDSMIGRIVRHRDNPWKVGTVEGIINGSDVAAKLYSNARVQNGSLLDMLKYLYGERDYFILRTEESTYYVDTADHIHYEVLERMPLTWRDIGSTR